MRFGYRRVQRMYTHYAFARITSVSIPARGCNPPRPPKRYVKLSVAPLNIA